LANVATIDYVTVATTGNATSFGSISSGYRKQHTSCSDATRGILWAGAAAAGYQTIDYITIQTTGGSTSFGNTLTLGYDGYGALSNDTYGLITGRSDNGIIEYITIASTGNAIVFGSHNHSGGWNNLTGVSNYVR
jgi:hypothetical protein